MVDSLAHMRVYSETYRKVVTPPTPVSTHHLSLRGHRGRRGHYFFMYYNYSRNGAISQLAFRTEPLKLHDIGITKYNSSYSRM